MAKRVCRFCQQPTTASDATCDDCTYEHERDYYR